MLCYAACPIYALDPKFIGPAAIALAQRYNLDSRDEGAKERLEVLSAHEGIWGCTFVGECTKVCPKNVDPAGAIQRYKLDAALDWVKAFVMPWGAAMNVHAPTPHHVRWYRRRDLHLLVAGALVVSARSSCARSAASSWRGSSSYLVKLIRALGQGEGWYEAFLPGCRHPPVVAVNVVTFGFVVFHAVTWFNLAPKAMVVSRRRPAPARRDDCRRQLRGLGRGRSAMLAWLVLGG